MHVTYQTTHIQISGDEARAIRVVDASSCPSYTTNQSTYIHVSCDRTHAIGAININLRINNPEQTANISYTSHSACAIRLCDCTDSIADKPSNFGYPMY